ncbi:SH3 domain-containing protein, partial [Primorskyibacter sp. 2E233]|uniref:SH3 domain-containing protein n=1 Tax=Primorskyibacter sp. 2E233 TaxID=3413431 RepID=UPI003BF3C12D
MSVTIRIATMLLAAVVSSAVWISPASAQPVSKMLDQCSSVAQGYFREPAARTDMRYNGQRSDGTHAINGRIFLETRYEDFACSYRRDGQRMVQFFAEGRVQNAYLPGGGNNTGGSSNVVGVTGVASNDVLNVRGGPGTKYKIVGALANGDQVRKLRCEKHGSSTWCEIEMMTDMHERGWVNARYLTGGSATHLPSKPPSAEAGGTRTV